ncbi:hypothetical protein RSSM_03765 [Rhodopirellula sallentina SM41]|uniref:Uncharacterized protein n=1 Tax=Rhodopirellula sallentina SM41 TaxID=1263870 RepID=M5UAC7_9BACT|nr:hypothetical protein RSSM_03765 [Rhodopirellula sallentina SM41]
MAFATPAQLCQPDSNNEFNVHIECQIRRLNDNNRSETRPATGCYPTAICPWRNRRRMCPYEVMSNRLSQPP